MKQLKVLREIEVIKLRIDKLDYKNRIIKHEIDAKRSINPWYPTHSLQAKIGNNTRKINALKRIMEDKNVQLQW